MSKTRFEDPRGTAVRGHVRSVIISIPHRPTPSTKICKSEWRIPVSSSNVKPSPPLQFTRCYGILFNKVSLKYYFTPRSSLGTVEL